MKKFLTAVIAVALLALAAPVIAGGLGLVQSGTEPGFVAQEAVLGTIPAETVWVIVGPRETLDLGFSISMYQANVAQERLNTLTGFSPPEECDFSVCSGLVNADLLMCVIEEQTRCSEKAPVRIFAGWIDPSDPLCDYAIPFCKGGQIVNKTDQTFSVPLADIFRRK